MFKNDYYLYYIIIFLINTLSKLIKEKKNKSNNKTTEKRTRTFFTDAQKQDICLKKLQKPKPKNIDLADEYKVSKGMISDILKESARWLALKPESYEASLKRQVKVNFSQIEEALSFWVEKAIENNITISGELLAQKARDFAILLNVQDFKGSEGWIVGFKRCHKIECYLKHREAASAP